MQSTKPTLDIIVVNWNSGLQLAQCLHHIRTASKRGLVLGRIVVVDNASNDSSLEAMYEAKDHTVIIRNRENVGFAAACNQGAAGSRADFLLFVNPDVFLGENALSITVQFLMDPSNVDVAICGPRLIGRDGATQRTCSRFPSPGNFYSKAVGLDRAFPKLFRTSAMVEWDHDSDRTVDQVMGACFFIRKNVFTEIGGFDERFFVYFEEVDLSLRCEKAGWKTRFLSEASATHLGGGCSRQVPAKRLFYSLRSRMLYAFKHFSPLDAAALCAMSAVFEPFSRLILAVVRRSVPDFRATLRGYWLLWSSMPSILKQARETAQSKVRSSASSASRSADGLSARAQQTQ